MEILGIYLDKNQIANGLVILAVVALVKYIWKWVKIVWAKVCLNLAKKLPQLNKVLEKILSILSLLFSPQARFVYLILAGLSLFYFIIQPLGFILSVFVISVGWSFYSEVTRTKSTKDPIFSDSFENFDAWEKIYGSPKIEKGFGQPSPSLLLPIIDNDAGKHTTIELKDLVFTNGIIELDVYLEKGSLIDLVFRGDIKAGKYYMARLDSRSGSGNHDGFLRNDGNGWNFIGHSSRNTTPDCWHKMRIVVKGDEFEMYDENGFIFSTTDDTYKKGSIGIFNEVSNAYLDNFSVKT